MLRAVTRSARAAERKSPSGYQTGSNPQNPFGLDAGATLRGALGHLQNRYLSDLIRRAACDAAPGSGKLRA